MNLTHAPLPQTIQRIGNSSKKPAINKESRGQRLDPFELMFFPANYDPSPLHSQHRQSSDEYNRKQNYINKIKKMSNADKRKHRAERDLRYLHKNAEQPSHEHEKVEEFDEESKLFCVHHLIGKCNKTTCKRVHQMREPRLFGVCKFFLTKSCSKGESCEFMHSEFPCRYYYTDLEHPKNTNEDVCQFNHGGPLNKKMNRYFRKHIEFWVKDITSTTPDEFEKKLNDFLERFDLKQIKLEEEHNHDKKKTIVAPRHSDKFTLERCLDRNQFEVLGRNGFDSIEKINNASVDDLLKCGLKMDQIYLITVNTCDGTRSPAQETIESDDELLDFGNSLEIDSDTHMRKETQQATMGKDPHENRPGLDEQSESDVTEFQSDCDSFPDFSEDFEISDDSDTDNLVINENESDNEDI